MPQLDIVSFFNQVIWLTVIFILLLTSFYFFLLRPYNKVMLVRKSLVLIFNALSLASPNAVGASLDQQISLLINGPFLKSTLSRSFDNLSIQAMGGFKVLLFITAISTLSAKHAS
jgi:hypothetical protein